MKLLIIIYFTFIMGVHVGAQHSIDDLNKRESALKDQQSSIVKEVLQKQENIERIKATTFYSESIVSSDLSEAECLTKLKEVETQIENIKKNLPEYSDEPGAVKKGINSFTKWLIGKPEKTGKKYFKNKKAERAYHQDQSELKALEQQLYAYRIKLNEFEIEALQHQKDQLTKELDTIQTQKKLTLEENKRKYRVSLLNRANEYGQKAYYTGVMNFLIEIMEGKKKWSYSKQYLIHSTARDNHFLKVSSVLDGYVIFSGYTYYDAGDLIQFATPRKEDAFYPEGTGFPGQQYWKITGKIEAETVLGTKKEIVVIEQAEKQTGK